MNEHTTIDIRMDAEMIRLLWQILTGMRFRSSDPRQEILERILSELRNAVGDLGVEDLDQEWS